MICTRNIFSTKYADSCEGIETKIGIQHHHAHIASCLVDNDAEGEVIGVAMDGLGFGMDGKFWGGEFFVADLARAERIAHLKYVPMPGGAKTIREPWRMAAVYLQKTFGNEFLDHEIAFNGGPRSKRMENPTKHDRCKDELSGNIEYGTFIRRRICIALSKFDRQLRGSGGDSP